MFLPLGSRGHEVLVPGMANPLSLNTGSGCKGNCRLTSNLPPTPTPGDLSFSTLQGPDRYPWCGSLSPARPPKCSGTAYINFYPALSEAVGALQVLARTFCPRRWQNFPGALLDLRLSWAFATESLLSPGPRGGPKTQRRGRGAPIRLTKRWEPLCPPPPSRPANLLTSLSGRGPRAAGRLCCAVSLSGSFY